MASSLVTLTPNDDDYGHGSDWDIVGGVSDAVTAITDANVATYIQSNTDGDFNIFSFPDIDTDDYLGVQWLSYKIVFGATVGSTALRMTVTLIDGSDDSTLVENIHNVISPINALKIDRINSGIIPYSSGTTPFTEAEINNLKLKLEMTENNTLDGSSTTYCKVLDLDVYAMMNVTDPDPPGTHAVSDNADLHLKNGLTSLKGGLTKIG